jgi:hypothetical protein
MRNWRCVFFLGLVLLLSINLLQAQITRQAGMIRGVVMDAGGNPLPGASITATSPSLMGKASDMSREDGSFRLPALPHGTYTITAELSGFKKVTLTDITVRVGMTVTVDVKMEPSAIEEQITVTAQAPDVDVRSTKITSIVTSEQIARLPLNRSLTNVLNLVPSTVGTIATYSGSIHGTLWRGVTYEVDGINANCPTTGGAFGMPQFDAVEEIEVMTGALPAQVGTTGGAFVNVVTRSGGNIFSGQIQTYYTENNLAQVLFSDEKLKAIRIGKPSFSLYDLDTSALLGGPIIKDKLWFFADLAFTKSSSWSPFIPTTIGNTSYEQYKVPRRNFRGNIKLTTEFSKHLRFYTYLSYSDTKNMYEAWSRKTEETTFWAKPKQYVGTANLTWIPNSNSFIDFRINLNHLDYPIVTRPEADANVCYYDLYTGYIWNGAQSWKSYITRHTSQGSIRLTHFRDNFLGGDHEIGAGVEFQFGWDRYAFARTNPMNWYYYNGNPYYYRGLYGLDEPHPEFGDGLLAFTNCGTGRNDSWKDLKENRIGGYFQDNWSIKNRLVLNLGLRVDYYNGWGGKATSTGIGGLPFEIGQTLEPELGFNPFGPFEIEPIKDVLVFTNFSPRIGASYDLFGNGRTALKLSYAHYSEHVPVMWFSEVSPAVMAQYEFNWWDLNENGQPDSPDVDRYDPRWGLGMFVVPDVEYLRSRVDKDLRAPVHNEFIAGVEHQLFRDLVVKLSYLHKKESKIYGWAKYDPDAGRFWYTRDQAPEWYVPFTTKVPAYGVFPEQEVTVYFMTEDSPWWKDFYLKMNIPEQFRKYDGVELQFEKRFSHGWSLGGSMVISKLTSLECGDSPNDFVNAPGRDGYDVPFQLKLFGTFNLPFGFVASFFTRYSLGSPWGRTVTVVPPDEWAAENGIVPWPVWVRLEANGARRDEAFTNTDFHLEKDFKLPYGTLAAFVDIYNLLGNTYIYYGQNPIATWFPEAEGTNVGSYELDYTYGRATGISATRVFKFSLKYKF